MESTPATRKYFFALLFWGALIGPAFARPNLTITPITWNVIGLDSNKVREGPNTFIVGVRVTNTGDAVAADLIANFVWDSTNPYINLEGKASLSRKSLKPGESADFYYNVVVSRKKKAYKTAREYHITALASNAKKVSTPTPRQLYVECLVSQRRNSVDSFTGQTNVYVGQIYEYSVEASTTTKGYKQIEAFFDFPNTIFNILASRTVYTAPAGGEKDRLYADGCGWENDPTSPDYNSCVGPCDPDGCKWGGSLTIYYMVEVVGEGSATVTGLIYDFSGSSFHYNSDYGVGVNSIDFVAQDYPTAVRLKDFSAEGYDGLVALEWETGAEINTLGFYLLRAENLDGPYQRVSKELILARGSGASGGRYLFLDRVVENGKVYYYYLEEIENTGKSIFYGPIESGPSRENGPPAYDSSDYLIIVGGNGAPTPATATPTPEMSAPPTPLIPTTTPSPLPTAYSPLPIIDYGDYRGDGTSDIAVFHPDRGLWSVRGWTRCYYGVPGDIPTSGDYEGDGTSDIAVFHPERGLWSIRGITRCYFGASGDIPVPGNYVGDGTADIAVFQPDSGLWAIKDLTRLYFGRSGDWPQPADYLGDGTTDIALFRPISGLWAIRESSRTFFGRSGDIPVPADYDGDWTDNIAVFRPDSGLWAIKDLTRIYFGGSGDIPVPADYHGYGVAEEAVLRPEKGMWAIRGLTRFYFGTKGSIPAIK